LLIIVKPSHLHGWASQEQKNPEKPVPINNKKGRATDLA
jgi:hypothetical protein